MKAILMSIQPKWCNLIAHGNKTIEVRKTKPKIEPPFKVYMYCTSSGFVNRQRTIPREPLFREKHTNQTKYTTSVDLSDKTLEKHELANGKVIGEFVCDKIDEYTFSNYEAEYRITDVELIATCLNHPILINYGKGKPLYGFHISQLKLYDEPKELGEFKKGCNDMFDPQFGSYCVYCEEKCNIKRPPQSWCYVEEQDDDKTK